MIVLAVLAYLALCFIVGMLGRDRRMGYIITVILCILLTPILMGLLLHLTEPRQT